MGATDILLIDIVLLIYINSSESLLLA